MYDRKAPPSARTIEYVEQDKPVGGQDVDHRAALAVDIDHRNLISLTGSPAGPASGEQESTATTKSAAATAAGEDIVSAMCAHKIWLLQSIFYFILTLFETKILRR